jgi:hypothetical protein
MKPKISLCAAAARPRYWLRFYASLLANKTPFEVIFVGPNPPENFALPDNFTFIKSDVKPAQCYQIAFNAAQGDLIGWTADDANYNYPALKCPLALDLIWNRYAASQIDYNDNKTILAMCPVEDSSAQWPFHYFFYADSTTPRMAPFGFINREWFTTLGGYDKNFICGQSENDVVMRGLADGGRVLVVQNAELYVHHGECHTIDGYKFRKGYDNDREFLESCWVYPPPDRGTPRNLSPQRLRPLEPFTSENILTENQGPAGVWAMEDQRK